MSTAPTLASLAASIAALQQTVSAQNVTIAAMQKQIAALPAAGGITWRVPLIQATAPPQGAIAGSVQFTRSAAMPASAVVTASLDGAAVAAVSPIAFAGMQPGLHKLQFFVNGAPELALQWEI